MEAPALGGNRQFRRTDAAILTGEEKILGGALPGCRARAAQSAATLSLNGVLNTSPTCVMPPTDHWPRRRCVVALALATSGGNIGCMDALAALHLQFAWGADEALEEAPIDRNRTAPAAALPTPPVHSPLAPALKASSIELAIASAEAAPTIEALRSALASFAACPLAATATSLVFADGNPSAGVILVDDTPGPDEDISGRPMTGPAGQLLDRMLGSIGLDRSSVLITNLIPWRPPGGRQATEAEVATCLPFLRRHLTLLRPRLIVSLGQAPTRALGGSEASIRRLRGKWQVIALPGLPDTVPMLPMMHPSALLRTPAAKKEAWADLLVLQQRLKRE